MKRAIVTVSLVAFVFLSPSSIFVASSHAEYKTPSTAAPAESSKQYVVPKDKEEKWKAIQNMLQQEYNVCIEHCGKNAACEDKCAKAFRSRQEKEYKSLTLSSNKPKDDLADFPSCPLCGMDRRKFDYSRMYVLYEDGSTFGTCSLHGAVIDLALKINVAPKSIMVADYNTRNLIDAEKAFWVIGGDRMGVMTKRAKWAFKEKKDAEEFIKQNKGKLGNFKEAVSAAFEDMYADVIMIREKRR